MVSAGLHESLSKASIVLDALDSNSINAPIELQAADVLHSRFLECFLSSKKLVNTPITLAARAPVPDLVQMLLEKGADPDLGEALHTAVFCLQENTVHLLLKVGANPNREVNIGQMVALQAPVPSHRIHFRHTYVVNIDLSLFSSVATPLALAAGIGHVSILNTLLEANASLDGSGGQVCNLERSLEGCRRGLTRTCIDQSI